MSITVYLLTSWVGLSSRLRNSANCFVIAVRSVMQVCRCCRVSSSRTASSRSPLTHFFRRSFCVLWSPAIPAKHDTDNLKQMWKCRHRRQTTCIIIRNLATNEWGTWQKITRAWWLTKAASSWWIHILEMKTKLERDNDRKHFDQSQGGISGRKWPEWQYNNQYLRFPRWVHSSKIKAIQ